MIPLFVLACATRTLPEPTVNAPEELIGLWVHEGGSEQWVQVGASLVGVGFLVQGGETVFFEALCLCAVDGQLAYTAIPGGDHAVAFPRVGPGLDFENPAHDYPTQIHYTVRGALLEARIAGPADAGQTFQMRAAPPVPAPELEALAAGQPSHSGRSPAGDAGFTVGNLPGAPPTLTLWRQPPDDAWQRWFEVAIPF